MVVVVVGWSVCDADEIRGQMSEMDTYAKL